MSPVIALASLGTLYSLQWYRMKIAVQTLTPIEEANKVFARLISTKGLV
jgi:hypothetical protein